MAPEATIILPHHIDIYTQFNRYLDFDSGSGGSLKGSKRVLEAYNDPCYTCYTYISSHCDLGYEINCYKSNEHYIRFCATVYNRCYFPSAPMVVQFIGFYGFNIHSHRNVCLGGL